eukprot:9371590-Lingulodinium_polyedra.AAC.1
MQAHSLRARARRHGARHGGRGIAPSGQYGRWRTSQRPDRRQAVTTGFPRPGELPTHAPETSNRCTSRP